jgi:hypothetical protein
MKKLRQLLRYIRGTAHKGIVLEPNKIINIEAYVDASYGVHEKKFEDIKPFEPTGSTSSDNPYPRTLA